MAGLLNQYQQQSNSIKHSIEQFLDNCKSENTRQQYKVSLTKSFGELFGVEDLLKVNSEMIESLTPHILNMYKNDLAKRGTFTNSTINNRLVPIRKLIEFLAGYGVIIYNTSALKLVSNLPDDREEIEMIPFAEIMKYIEYTEDSHVNGYEKSMVLKLALDTGLRLDEVVSLKWSQFRVDGNVVTIMSNKENKGKGNQDYLDKIDISIYEDLLKLKNESSNVFSMSTRTMERVIETLNKQFNNLDEDGKGLYSFHSIKKTCVTMVYRRTGCILQAQKKARHKSLETTRRYLRVEDIEITGILSIMRDNNTDAYKEATRDQLLEAIQELPYEAKVLLSSHIIKN